MSIKVEAEHGIICRLPDVPFGYFGWPSVARLDDGTLVTASSGLRAYHVCPWGKTVLHFSTDNGRTWSDSQVLNDSMIDDRDAGVISLGGKKMLVSWFTSDTRKFVEYNWVKESMTEEYYHKMIKKVSTWDDQKVKEQLGSRVMISEDGNTWSEPVKVAVSAPHGPVLLANGDLLYFGKELQAKGLKAIISKNEGLTWDTLGSIPIPADTEYRNFHEPHAVELLSGKIIGMIRYQHTGKAKAYESFSLFQTESIDGGKTWTEAKPTGIPGSPPHILRHSSGTLVCVYGYRKKPFGQRAMISHDDGATWNVVVLRDDGPDGDLGYPASVELEDGSIFTVYYQKYADDEQASLLWTRWELQSV